MRWYGRNIETNLTEQFKTTDSENCKIMLCLVAMQTVLLQVDGYLPKGFIVNELADLSQTQVVTPKCENAPDPVVRLKQPIEQTIIISQEKINTEPFTGTTTMGTEKSVETTVVTEGDLNINPKMITDDVMTEKIIMQTSVMATENNSEYATVTKPADGVMKEITVNHIGSAEVDDRVPNKTSRR